jgi:hypothetical protein
MYFSAFPASGMLEWDRKRSKPVAAGTIPTEKPVPQVLTFVVADLVYRDDVSERFSVLGTRSAFRASTLPYEHDTLGVYAVLTDGRGMTPITVRLIDVDETQEPLFTYETALDFVDPIDELEVAFVFSDLVFPALGEYRLQLRAAEQLLCERRLRVLRPDEPDAEGRRE